MNIKLRAYDFLRKRMEYTPNLDIQFHDNGVAYCAMYDEDGNEAHLPLEPFTGLLDKNGTEIYEGDLVRIPAKDKYEETTFNCFEVFYHDNECIGGQNIGFCINRMHPQGHSAGGYGYKFTPQSMADFEVIGNIHTDSHLMGDSNG